MKWILLAGTLALSGTAMAQTAPMPDTTTQTAPATTDATPAAPQQPVTTVTTTTDTTGTPTAATVDVASPGNYTAPPAPDPAASYPWCTRAVTDHCKQRRDPK